MKASTRRKWKILLKSPLTVATLTLISGVIIAIVTYNLTLNSQIKIADRQQRQLYYSKLLGKKIMLAQILTSRMDAEINFNYFQKSWVLLNEPKDSYSYLQWQKWQTEGNALNLETGKNFQELFEIIGFIRTSFPRTGELERLTSKILNFSSIEIPINSEQIKNIDSLKILRDQQTAALPKYIKDNYVKPIDDLSEYLRNEIERLD